GIALLHAEAFVRVAAHGRVAAGAEEQHRRNAIASLRQHRSRLGAKLEFVLGVDWQPRREAADDAAESARRYAGNAAAALKARHPARGRREQAVGATPVLLIFEISRVRADPFGAGGLLLIDVERRRNGALVALLDRVPARANGGGPRNEALDVGPKGAHVVSADPAGLVRRLREAHGCRLQLRLEAPLEQHLQASTIDVDIAIARVAAELHVGGIAKARFDAPRRPFDDRHLDSRVVRL